jgi:mannose/fructose/N-acetylgalactosamine-specific phosphotransferase system component IIC
MTPLAAVFAAEAGFPWLALGLTALLGAALALDETALVQTWFSQPLPAGILAGLVWGDPGLGLALGLPLQLLAVGNLPLGQIYAGDKVTPLLGLVGASTALGWDVAAPFAGTGPAASRLGWLLVAAALGSMVGDGVLRWERRLHNGLMLGGLRSLRDGRYQHMERAHVRCLLTTALRGALSTVLWCLLALVIWLPLFEHLPGRLAAALGMLPWLTPALAIGALGELYGSRHGLRWIAGGAMATLALAWALIGGVGK